jgi:hypothetical protein
MFDFFTLFEGPPIKNKNSDLNILRHKIYGEMP